MEFKLDEEKTFKLNEAFKAAREREGALGDQALLEREEPDERLRRLVQADGQLTQAWMCYRGLPAQAVIWAYQGVDNAMHAALVSCGVAPSRNHRAKVDQFRESFGESEEDHLADRLAELRKVWNDVRYERTALSRETCQEWVNLAYKAFYFCLDIVADQLGIETMALREKLAAIADRVGLPVLANLDKAMELIEYQEVSREQYFESRGLSGIASQLAHGGRDISLEVVCDRSEVRDLLEEDGQLAAEILRLYTAFHDLVTGLVAKRLSAQYLSDPDLLKDPTRLLSVNDFTLTCVASYAGLSMFNDMRRILAVTGEASQQACDSGTATQA